MNTSIFKTATTTQALAALASHPTVSPFSRDATMVRVAPTREELTQAVAWAMWSEACEVLEPPMRTTSSCAVRAAASAEVAAYCDGYSSAWIAKVTTESGQIKPAYR